MSRCRSRWLVPQGDLHAGVLLRCVHDLEDHDSDPDLRTHDAPRSPWGDDLADYAWTQAQQHDEAPEDPPLVTGRWLVQDGTLVVPFGPHRDALAVQQAMGAVVQGALGFVRGMVEFGRSLRPAFRAIQAMARSMGLMPLTKADLRQRRIERRARRRAGRAYERKCIRDRRRRKAIGATIQDVAAWSRMPQRVVLGFDGQGLDWTVVDETHAWSPEQIARAAAAPPWVDTERIMRELDARVAQWAEDHPLPLHRTQATWPQWSCSTCDGGGCPDCTDPA